MAHEHHVDENENELSMMSAELFKFFEAMEDYDEDKKLILMLSDGNEGMLATCGYDDDGAEAFEHLLSHAKAIMRVNGGDLQIISRESPIEGAGNG